MPGLGGFDSFDASEGTKVTAGAGKHVVVANSLPKLAAIHLGTARRKASQGEERKEKDKERLHVDGGRKIISFFRVKYLAGLSGPPRQDAEDSSVRRFEERH